jgi:hypothetical protein
VLAWCERRATTEELKHVIGVVMPIFRRDKAQAEGRTVKTDTQRAQAKQEYQQRKAEYQSRKYGILCVKTGKQLMRRIKDEAGALRQAAELSRKMDREYRVISLLGAPSGEGRNLSERIWLTRE